MPLCNGDDRLTQLPTGDGEGTTCLSRRDSDLILVPETRRTYSRRDWKQNDGALLFFDVHVLVPQPSTFENSTTAGFVFSLESCNVSKQISKHIDNLSLFAAAMANPISPVKDDDEDDDV